MFDSNPEEYLQENHGNVNTYYEEIARGMPTGYAFVSAICKPDVIRLRKSDLFDGIQGMAMDGPELKRIIEWLKQDLVNYPEDHPIWQTR